MYGTTREAAALVNRLQSYGVQCDGEVVTEEYHDQVSYDQMMALGDFVRAGGLITRVRMLTGNWGGVKMADISYIHGTLPNGTIVPIYLDVENGFPLWGPRGAKATFIEWAKSHGVYAKGCGLLDESNWSVLHG